MIDLLIFFLHAWAWTFAFYITRKYDGMKSAFLAVVLLALVFLIGWVITGAISKIIWQSEWNSEWFTGDTLSLLLLVYPEWYFFKKFILESRDMKREEKGTEEL